MIKVSGVIERLQGIHAVALDKKQLYINNMSMKELNTLIDDAVAVITLLEAPLPDQDKADLDVIHRIRSGSLRKMVCREYAIYNGDWYRDHPWNVPKEHEPHVLAPDEFGECGTGWEEAWVSCDEKEPETYLERCAWAGKNMAFEESGFSTIDQEMQLDRYNKVGGFRIWVGDYPPSEEMRKAVKWDG